jgi:hypothetical protein
LLRWIPSLILAGLLLAHALILAAYAFLVRDWRKLRPLLPRNLAILLVLICLNVAWFGHGPIKARYDRWRNAGEFAKVERVQLLLSDGKFVEALRARREITTPQAGQAADELLTPLLPTMVSRAIALGNKGDYVAAVALATALPPDGPNAAKRNWLLKRWTPYAEHQLQAHMAAELRASATFRRALEGPLQALDKLTREYQPRAEALDSKASRWSGGRPTHPMAPQIATASARARELGDLFLDLPANDMATRALRSEAISAAAALQRAFEESLSYANENDAKAKGRASQAFASAAEHRKNVQAMLQTLEHPPMPDSLPSGEPGHSPTARPQEPVPDDDLPGNQPNDRPAA